LLRGLIPALGRAPPARPPLSSPPPRGRPQGSPLRPPISYARPGSFPSLERPMADEGSVLVQDDAVPAAADDRPMAASRSVDLVVSLLIFALAVLLGWDSWRLGAGWASDGPQAGYFPFYLSVLMGAASLYGVAVTLLARQRAGEAFVTRQQFERVLK